MADDRRQQRDNVIRDLESKPYRTADEEERLSRLRLDSEFEKRAAEQARRDDSDGEENHRNAVRIPWTTSLRLLERMNFLPPCDFVMVGCS